MAPPAVTTLDARCATLNSPGEAPAQPDRADVASRLRGVARARDAIQRALRFTADLLRAASVDDLSDRIDQISEYRRARAQASQYAMLRNINR